MRFFAAESPSTTGTPESAPHPAGPAERTEALRQLARGHGGSGPSPRWLKQLRARGLEPGTPWVVPDGRGRPRAAALVAGTSGGTGLILHSPIGQAPGAPLASVVHAASAEADRRRVCFTQALLEPAARARRTMLERAGFVEAAELSYMRRAVRAAEAAGPATPAEAVARSVPGARGWRWAPQRRALFERAIEASYEDTRDCPRLVGLRSTARVLNGHMACGAGFDPQGWHVVCDETEAPVAVMLLNPASEPRTLELVYLGIARPYRGLGLGRALIGAALAMARGRGDATLRLAVDTANEPAMRLYRSMRFVPYARRAAFLHAPRLEGAEAPRRDPAASD